MSYRSLLTTLFLSVLIGVAFGLIYAAEYRSEDAAGYTLVFGAAAVWYLLNEFRKAEEADYLDEG